ncbi:hypothetical protein [Klebsiella michiganensis]|uniref:hypothetical protein n=1 Tax=Klebsiella michiganensis TaxID=1134687 RepID=UPI004067B20C
MFEWPMHIKVMSGNFGKAPVICKRRPKVGIAISDYIERVLCKTIRQLVIAQGSSTAVSHTKRARFTVTRQKTPALTSGDTVALRGHLRCQVPVDNMG